MSKEAGMGPEEGWAHGGEPFKLPLAPETGGAENWGKLPQAQYPCGFMPVLKRKSPAVRLGS
jgi:hypothetical protein